MFDRMTRGIPAKQPICREILNEIQIWSLDEKELFSAQKIKSNRSSCKAMSLMSNLCCIEEKIAFCLR
jgi:hypothetical protein